MQAPLMGVDVEDLRLPIKDAIRRAAELAFEAIEIPTAAGETAPRNLSSSGRRHLARFVQDLGLKAAALTPPESGEPSPISLAALRRIGEHADSRGIIYAIRPSYDSRERLRRVL